MFPSKCRDGAGAEAEQPVTQLLHCWGYFKHFISLLSLWLQGEAAARQGQLQGPSARHCPQLSHPGHRQGAGCAPQIPKGAKAGVSQLCCFATWAETQSQPPQYEPQWPCYVVTELIFIWHLEVSTAAGAAGEEERGWLGEQQHPSSAGSWHRELLHPQVESWNCKGWKAL